ncbi:MAG: hypothetical protein CSA13_01245 [Clostridiales bacterium]|nr:MAG: hypothetical protein CSA13_01245 [Clostridiales bacterium]
MTIDQFAKIIFEKAKARNFDAYELYYQYGNSMSLEAYQGEIHSYSDSTVTGVNFRVVIGGKSGSCYSEVLDEEAIDYLLDSAYQAATHIENDDDIHLVEPGLDYPALDIYDEAFSQVDSAQKIDFVIGCEKSALEQPIISQVNAMHYVDGMTGCRLFNSNGLDIGYQTNNAYAYIAALAKDGSASHSAIEFTYGRDFDALVDSPLVARAVDQLNAKMGAKSIASGTYPVVFAGKAFADLLSVFISSFSAEMTQKGMSLLAGKVGEQIAAAGFSLIDDPLLKDGLSSAPFDGEGVPTYKKYLIKDGELLTLLHNMNTAKKDGVETTGNASRGSFKATIGVAPTNAYVEPGDLSVEQLYQSVGDGLVIEELDGLHAGANPISGEFSLSARGFKLAGGARDQAVNQIVVSGNFFKVIKNIAGIADDLVFRLSAIGAPSLYVGELSVAGSDS